jgi:hypothetical protein
VAQGADEEPSGKVRAFLARFRNRAEKVIDDVPAVEAIVEAAHRRVERHRFLQTELAVLDETFGDVETAREGST